jgi:hypothetical protein
MCKQCKKCDPICKPHQQYTLEKCGICKKKKKTRKKERKNDIPASGQLDQKLQQVPVAWDSARAFCQQ